LKVKREKLKVSHSARAMILVTRPAFLRDASLRWMKRAALPDRIAFYYGKGIKKVAGTIA